MRAYMLLRPGRIELQEVPRPEPEPGGIVVRIRSALTCGTDLKAFLRGHPKFAMPTPFGHEFSGDIAALGTGVRGLREGDPVMIAPTAPCGSCYYCAREQENLCPQVMRTMIHGAYAEFIQVPESIVRTNLFSKPAALPYSQAALLEPLACVLHGLSHLSLRSDDTVVLVGAGAFALLHLLVLRARGIDRVIVVTRGERRADRALDLGADDVLVGGVELAREPVLARTGGRGADVVIECTGQVAVWEAAPGLVRPGGQVMLFGGCPSGSHVRLDCARLHYDQVRIISPFHFTPRDVRRAHELLTGSFDARALVSGEYALEHLPEVFERLQRGDGAKFAIVPGLQ